MRRRVNNKQALWIGGLCCGGVFLIITGIIVLFTVRLRRLLSLQAYDTVLLLRMKELQAVAILFCAFFFFALLCGLGYFLHQRRKGQKQSHQLAYIDEITGLPTKAKHRKEMEALLAEGGTDYVYVSLEIDNFKYVNEMFGYEFGNLVLRQVADGIRRALRTGELASRTAGARFGLLLCGAQEEVLRKRLSELFRQNSVITNIDTGTTYAVTFTAGCYQLRGGEEAGDIREFANFARESARKLFDNSIEFYNEALKERRSELEELEFDMLKALEDDQFSVYLQPKYRLYDEQIVGAEALVRWIHPSKGLICPDKFIPLFESNGFIVKVDMLVLEHVCRCIRGWLDNGVEPLVLSVNLSRVHLYDQDLVSKLVELVDRYAVPHELIEFELTETAIYEEMDNPLNVLHELKDAGFVLSMDDFGSGYSSLNMLKRLPVDILKLDKAFLENFREDDGGTRDRTIISHIIAMAKALDISVLAEGVETGGQREFLLNSNCDMIQGFYYAKPMEMWRFMELYLEMKSVMGVCVV